MPLTFQSERELRDRSSDRPDFSTFAPLPSNVGALETVSCFAKGSAVLSAVSGPCGWGKTHLIESVASSLGAPVLQASEWADSGARTSAQLPLILDNAQEALKRTRTRVRLSIALERRAKSRRPTLVAFGDVALPAVRAFLPLANDWLLGEIKCPSVAERVLVVREMASREDLELSDPVVQAVARRMSGNGRTLRGAMQRLRLAGRSWLTDEASLEACGILTPFFADCASWDLGGHIQEVAEIEAQNDPAMARSIGVYVLLRVAKLPEDSVARYFETQPTRVYGEAVCHLRNLKTCCRTNELTAKVIRAAAAKLADA